MKRILFFSLIAFFSLQAQADTIGECYRKAVTKAQIEECLSFEHKSVKKSYDAVVERVLAEARSIDRAQKTNKLVANNFMKSNAAFKQYVDDECSFIGTSYGKRGQSAELSCRINLLRVRAAALEGRYVSRK